MPTGGRTEIHSATYERGALLSERSSRCVIPNMDGANADGFSRIRDEFDQYRNNRHPRRLRRLPDAAERAVRVGPEIRPRGARLQPPGGADASKGSLIVVRKGAARCGGRRDRAGAILKESAAAGVSQQRRARHLRWAPSGRRWAAEPAIRRRPDRPGLTGVSNVPASPDRVAPRGPHRLPRHVKNLRDPAQHGTCGASRGRRPRRLRLDFGPGAGVHGGHGGRLAA